MTAFEYLQERIHNLTESSNLLWRNPDYVRAVWRNASDICAEMEQFAADVIYALPGFDSIENLTEDSAREFCFRTCFTHIVQI